MRPPKSPPEQYVARDEPHVRKERVARRQRAGRSEHVDATAFLYAIIDAAERLSEARAFDGSRALPFDARSTLLRAIERCGGAPSFADLARLLQVTLTPAGRRLLEAQCLPPVDWVFTLLNGLAPATMASCEHVLRVLAARLDRYEREARRARRRGPGAY